MKHALIGLFLVGLSSVMAAEPVFTDSSVESIGLFKNGLAYVRRQVTVDKPGTYIIKDVPQPVYGTFWIESDADVVARVTKMDLEEDITTDGTPDDFFAGKRVTVQLKGETFKAPVKGVWLKDTPDKTMNWNRNYNPNPYGYYGRQPQGYPQPPSSGQFIRLRTDTGVTLLSRSEIASITADDCHTKRMREKPVLIVEVKQVKKGRGTVQISYLTQGISWAAGYTVDLSVEGKLTLTQKAVVKNELMDFENVNMQLISGFPHVKFGHVTSPLSLNTSWSQFFQQLNQQPNQRGGVSSNVIRQQAVMFNSAPASASAAGMPDSMSDGVDVFYNDIGDKTMKNGDALAFNVATAAAPYEKIVVWDIPDNRQANGRYIQDYERQNHPEKYQNNIWDAIRFKNPFKFPMTTAAAAFVRDGKFIGETVSYWVNPGEETLLNTSKALSVSTRSTENELPGEREKLVIFGRRFQKSKVAGKLVLKNYRKTPVKVMIKRRFSGELLAADDNPTCQLREEGVYSVNQRNDLVWELTVEPGKEKEIDYSYEVLVDY